MESGQMGAAFRQTFWYIGAGHKPGSVSDSPLVGALPDDDHSSSLDVTVEVKQSTRELERTTLKRSLLDLAPDGVYLAPVVTGGTGELLPHRFTLTWFRGPGPRGAGGLFSVALSCPLPGLGVTQHPVLRSPDFPPFCAMAKQRSSVLLQHTLLYVAGWIHVHGAKPPDSSNKHLTCHRRARRFPELSGTVRFRPNRSDGYSWGMT